MLNLKPIADCQANIPNGHVISIFDHLHPERKRVEDFLCENYARAFGGKLVGHYPILMSIRDANGNILAASGYRLAKDEELFLEKYTGAPIDQVLSTQFAQPVQRNEIAEIGNLVASDCDEAKGVSIFLFRAMAQHLANQGLKYACATAIKSLRRAFRMVNFSTKILADADISKVTDPENWGTYYSNDPKVIAGNIKECAANLHGLSLPNLYSRLHFRGNNV